MIYPMMLRIDLASVLRVRAGRAESWWSCSPNIRAGGAVLVPVDVLRRWLDEQAAQDPDRIDAVVSETLRSIRG
jgi:hypothetical protein